METLTEEPPAKTSRAFRRYSPPVLIAVVVLHFVLGGVATVWVVSKYSGNRKLTFRAGAKSPNPSERALEHRVQLQKKLEAVSAPPAVPQRILTTGAAKFTLPPVPEMKSPETATTRPLLGAGGSGLAFGTANGSSISGGAGGGSQINFFGIRDVSHAVVIMIDVSDSMFTRTGDAAYPSALLKHGTEQSFQVVRDQAITLVKALTPQTRFDIIRWSGGAYAWKPELVPATEENKSAGIEHIQNGVDYKTAKAKGGGGGTRHDKALELAFSLKPETIYMLTDGNATIAKPGGGMRNIEPNELYQIAAAGQKSLPQKAHLHTIYYLNDKEKNDEREMLMNLASRNGGQFKTVPAKNRGQRAPENKKIKKRK